MNSDSFALMAFFWSKSARLVWKYPVRPCYLWSVFSHRVIHLGIVLQNLFFWIWEPLPYCCSSKPVYFCLLVVWLILFEKIHYFNLWWPYSVQFDSIWQPSFSKVLCMKLFCQFTFLVFGWKTKKVKIFTPMQIQLKEILGNVSAG